MKQVLAFLLLALAGVVVVGMALMVLGIIALLFYPILAVFFG